MFGIYIGEKNNFTNIFQFHYFFKKKENVQFLSRLYKKKTICKVNMDLHLLKKHTLSFGNLLKEILCRVKLDICLLQIPVSLQIRTSVHWCNYWAHSFALKQHIMLEPAPAV